MDAISLAAPAQHKSATPPRRWYRFSLRSLLIFTAVVSPLLGWIASERAQSRQEMILAKQFELAGEDVILIGLYFDESSYRQAWWKEALAPLLGQRIWHLSFSDGNHADLKLVVQLSTLRSLAITKHDFSDLTSLPCLRKLGWLTIDDSAVTDLSPLKDCKELMYLTFSNTKVESIAPLAELAELRLVDASGSLIHDLGPLSGHRKLVDLNAANTPVADLTSLAGLPQLEKLNLFDTPVRDIKPLAKLKRLKSLSLGFDPLSSAVASLKEIKTLLELKVPNSSNFVTLQDALPNRVIVSPQKTYCFNGRPNELR